MRRNEFFDRPRGTLTHTEVGNLIRIVGPRVKRDIDEPRYQYVKELINRGQISNDTAPDPHITTIKDQIGEKPVLPGEAHVILLMHGDLPFEEKKMLARVIFDGHPAAAQVILAKHTTLAKRE